MIKGFLLGLSSGTVCLAYCAPILIPYLLAEGKDVRRSCVTIAFFLSGRLAGYLAFAVLAWITNALIIQSLPRRTAIMGGIYVALALSLIWYGFRSQPRACAAESLSRSAEATVRTRGHLFTVTLGLLTGLNLCPPFLLAWAGAAEAGGLGHCVLFFLAFFAGTAIYVIPLPAMGLLGRHDAIKLVGRLTAGVVGVYYLCSGLLALHQYVR